MTSVRNSTGGLVLCNCEIIRQTEKAVYLTGSSNETGVGKGRFMGGWIPKSAITESTEGTHKTIFIALWLKGQKFFYI